MTESKKLSIQSVKEVYREVAKSGPYGHLAPTSKANAKCKYIAEVLDAAILPRVAAFTNREFVLDYGCGTGILTNQLLDYFSQVKGVDISEEMLAIAEELKPNTDRIQFRLIDGQHLPFKNEFFDMVISRACLCLVPDDVFADVVAEICRVLKRGGRFLWLEQISESPLWRNPPQSPYVSLRSTSEIFKVMKDHGMVLNTMFTARKPRFPWIYLIQLGIVPFFIYKRLAKLEALFNRRFCSVKTKRWHHVLFEFDKV